MKFRLVSLTLILVAVFISTTAIANQEWTVVSYSADPAAGSLSGAGWAVDGGLTKLTDDVIPAGGDENWGANMTAGWNMPTGQGPTVIFNLNASSAVDIIRLSHFGATYGFNTVDISASDNGTDYTLIGTYDNKYFSTTAHADSLQQDIFVQTQGKHFKFEFASIDPGYSAAWTMLNEVEFFEADPNYISVSTPPVDATVMQGDDAEFTVAVIAKTTPLSYQWKLDGVDIPGATADAFQVVGATSDDAGEYTCVISNSENDGVESPAATLTVLVPPELTPYGNRVLSSNPVVYWSFDEEDGDAIDNVSLMANRSLNATSPIRIDHGDLGNAVSFQEFDNVFGATNLDTGINTLGAFAIEFWARVNDLNMTNRYLTEIGTPTSGNNPGIIYGYQGMEMEFFGADGAGAVARSDGFTYTDPNDWTKWQHIVMADLDDNIVCYVNGAKLDSFTYESVANSRLNLSDIAIGSVRKYHSASPGSLFLGDMDEVAIYLLEDLTKEQAVQKVESIALHNDFDGPAYVTADPVGMTAPPGTDATLYCSAAGAEPISYQWKKDGEDIEGATSTILVLEGVQPGVDDGTYSCMVSNAEGNQTSEGAVIEVACYYDIPGDLNNDCVVDMVDFAILSAHWLEDSSVQL